MNCNFPQIQPTVGTRRTRFVVLLLWWMYTGLKWDKTEIFLSHTISFSQDNSSSCLIFFPIIHFLASDIHKDHLNALTGQKQKRTTVPEQSAQQSHSCLISGNLNGKQTCKVSIHSKSEILCNSCKILGWSNSFTYSFSSLWSSSVYCPGLCEKGRKPQ